MDATPPQELILATRAEKITEAKRIIEAARERGIVLRLLGGLAVRFHCESLDFCEREHGDIDFIGRRHDANRITSLFADLGFEEIRHVRQATEGRQLQFARDCRCEHDWAEYGGRLDDHIDVFLDTFKMEHAVDLGDRLELGEYTIDVSDLLLTKLQMTDLDEKDERDIFTLLQDLELGTSDDPGLIDVPYVARLCAENWGLFHDVERNLERLSERLGAYVVDAAKRDQIRAKMERLHAAVETEPKSRAWRLRAKIGEHRPWHHVVEEQT